MKPVHAFDLVWRNAGKAVRTYAAWRACCREQYMAPERLQPIRERRLREIVRHAYDTVPYYRDLFDGARIGPADIRDMSDLSKVPVTTRAEMQRVEEEARISTAHRDTATYRGRTGGTSGRPLSIYRSPDHDHERSGRFLRALSAAGYRLGERLMLVTEGWSKRHSAWSGWRKVFANDPPETLLRSFQEHRPRVLYGWVTSLLRLGSMLHERGVPVDGVRSVVTTAETLDPATRRLLESLFGAKVFDLYGCSEFGTIAWECDRHDGYHVAEDALIAELLPIEGTATGRLVITGFTNFVTPFIRYEIGDMALPGTGEPCACGVALPRLRRIEGRVVDCLRLRDGGLLSPHVLIDELEERAPEVQRFQVLQDAISRLRVRIQLDGVAQRDIDGVIRDVVHDCVGRDLEVIVKRKPMIEPTDGRWFRVVECRVPEQASP